MKRCSICHNELPSPAFSNHTKSSDGKMSECKLCHNKRYRKNSKRHRAQVKTAKALRTAKTQRYVDNYLSNHPCVDCGETDVVVLDFDHVRGKKVAAISYMVGHGHSLESIIKEMAKCEIRCANDHRRKTIRNKDYAPVV